jgi:regulator of sigma E protease
MILIVQIILVAFMFGFVMAIHELGHYITAKKLGIRVLDFALGFGPEIFGRTVNGTRYSLRWIPLGAFVKLAGEDFDESGGLPDEFYSKKWYQRLAVVIGGPAMNYISAFFIFFVMIAFWGVQYQRPVVKYVQKDMPAAVAGLMPGDEIVAIDGKNTRDTQIVSTIIKTSANKKLIFSVQRNGAIVKSEMTPLYDNKLKQTRIGIIYDSTAAPYVVKVGFFTAIKETVNSLVFWTVTPLKYIYTKLILLEAPDDVSGPVGIVQAAYFSLKHGVKLFLTFIGVLSVALGFFNLLPIPLVDGGYCVFFIFEGIFGKPVHSKVMKLANSIGFALLIMLALYATYRDIDRTRSGFWKQTERVK